MKLNKINILLLFFCIVLGYSCSEDFLVQEPKTEETEEDFYKEFENVEMAVTAAYSRLCYQGLDVMSFLAQNAMSDDGEAGGEHAGDRVEWGKLNLLTHDAGNDNIKDMWRVNYKGVRLANTALLYLEPFEKTELVKRRIAECKTLRAHYHFEILRFYGEIPIVEKVLSPEEFYPARQPIADVLHFIQTDLEEAYPDLPKRSQLGAELGRISQGTAQSLLARAYLYEASYAKNWSGDARFGDCQNKYADALKAAEMVINSGEYKLVGVNGERFDSWWGKAADGETDKTYDGKINAFRWIFSVDGDNSQEGVFEVQNVMDGLGWFQTHGSAFCVYSTCRFTHSSPTTMYGWGFNCPSDYLLKAFANNDTRETDLSAENKERIAENADPRFFTTVGKENTEMMIRLKGTTPDSDGNLVWARMKLDNVPTGTIGRKYEAHPDESILNPKRNANENGAINIKFIRYADVVLIAAEAAYETGDKTKALNYVNQVRTRARNCSDKAEGSIYPKNLNTVTFGDIIHERRIEFAMELSRFFDLIRWRLGKTYIDGTSAAEAESPNFRVQYVEGKHEFLPIPTEQIMLSEGTLVQYDAWK